MRYVIASLILIVIVCLTLLIGDSRPMPSSDMSVIDGGVSSTTNRAAVPHSGVARDKNLTDADTSPQTVSGDVGKDIGEPLDPDDPASWPQTNYDELGENIGEPIDPDDPASWPQTNYDELGENIGEPIDPDDPASWPQTNYDEPGENIGQPIDPDDPASWP